MYYVWRSDVKLYDKFLYVSKSPDKLNPGDWIRGKAGVQGGGLFTLVGDKKYPATCSDMILTQFNLPVLSPKALDVLKAAGVNNLETYPIQIKHPKKKDIEKTYKLINVAGLVECLDKAHATFETFSGDPNKLSWLAKYKVFENKIPKDLKVFRLAEFSYHVLAHASVKEAFEKAGLTGAKFTPTEKYI